MANLAEIEAALRAADAAASAGDASAANDARALAAAYAQAKQNPSQWDRTKREAGLRIRDVANAVVGLPVMAGDAFIGALNTVQDRVGKLTGLQVEPYENVSALKERALSGLPKPETTEEKFVSSAVEGAGSMIVPFGAARLARPTTAIGQTAKNIFSAAPGMQAVSGATAGLSVEGAKQAGLPPEAQFVVGVLGGMTPALLEMIPGWFTRNPGKPVAQAMSETTPTEWAMAAQAIREAKAKGIDLTAPEAFGPNHPIQALMAKIAQTDTGAPIIAKAMQERPAQMASAVESELGTVGKNVGSQQAANVAEEAGTKAITAAEKFRTKAAQPFYEAAKKDVIPASKMEAVIGDIDSAISADKTGILAGQLKELRSRLVEIAGSSGVPSKRVATVTPTGDKIYSFTEAVPATRDVFIKDIENLDRARKFFREKIELPAFANGAIDKETAARIGSSLSQLKTEMMKSSKNYEAGKAVFAKISQDVVDPMIKGPVGVWAGRGFDPAKETQLNRIYSEIIGEKASPERVRILAEELRKVPDVPKGAFDNVLRSVLEDTWNKAVAQDPTGLKAGASFARKMIGGPQDEAVIRAAIWESAKNHGRDPKVAWQGFKKLFDTLEATGRAPSKFGAGGLDEGIASSAGSIQTGVIRTMWQNVVDRIFSGDHKKIAEAMVSENSLAEIWKLGKMSPKDPKSQNLVASIVSSWNVKDEEKK